MLGRGPEAGADHAADDQRRFRLAAEHVLELGGLIEDLVEAHAHEIDEHELGHRPHAAGRRPGRRADIGRFRKRRIEKPAAVFGVQALGDAENAAPGIFLAGGAGAADDILSHHDHRRIAGHFLVKRLIERLTHADLASHCLCSPSYQ